VNSTVRDITHDLLRSLNLSTVFGNPGSTELGFLEAFPADFSYVLGLHEGAVVAMADGYAQGRDDAALVNLHSAAGLGNGMGAIVNAFHNRAPIIVLCGQQDRRHLALEPYLFARSVELAKPYVKWSNEPARALDVPDAICRAYQVSMAPPRGPTLVSVPAGDWDEEGQPNAPCSVMAVAASPDPPLVKRLASLLRASARPVLIAGDGIDRTGAWEVTIELAEALNCPVWTAPQAPRACFPEDHPLFQGHLEARADRLSEQLAQADLALVLGAPAFSYLTYHEAITPLPDLVLITDDPDEASRAGATFALVANIRSAVMALLREEPLRRRPDAVPERVCMSMQQGRGLDSRTVMRELAAAMPPDAILVEEVPSNRPELRQFVKMIRPRSFYSSASGGLGYAMPAAVGMKLAHPTRPVVCLVGDGSALYTIQAIWTAVQHGIGVIFIVINNNGYNILRNIAKENERSGIPSLEIPGLDFLGLAESFGCSAYAVHQEGQLTAALQHVASDEPQMIHISLCPAMHEASTS